MCGLLGFASTEQFCTRTLRQKFLTTGYPMIAVDRGMESSGLALVETENTEPLMYKKALCGWDFIQQFQTQKYIGDIDKYQVAIGHVRASTRGLVSDHNAHPFQYDHITLVHNGHIRNANSLKNSEKAGCFVDSAMVAYSMAHNGELETLQEVDGGFVFVWWNSENKTLNIARNTERPLFMAYIEKENSMFWASELTHLLHLLRAPTRIDEKIGHLYPGSMTWYQYSLKDLRSPKKIPFAKSQGRQKAWTAVGGTSGNGSGQTGKIIADPYEGWTEEELEAWAQHGTQVVGSVMTKDSTRASRTTSDRDEIDLIRESLRNQRIKDVKISGVPTSTKRIKRATQELSKLGITFKEQRMVKPISWHVYKNQRGFGSMICHMRQGEYVVEVINVPDTMYPLYLDYGLIVVQCQNVRFGPNNTKRIVATVSDGMKEKLEKRQKFLEDKQNQQQEQLPDTKSTKEALGSIERAHDGPGGQQVTRARFLELVTQGCGNCRREIAPEEHKSVVWVGSPASPVCYDCSGNQAIMESLGFPNHHKIVH